MILSRVIAISALLILATAALGTMPDARGQTGPGWVTLVDAKTMGDWDRIGDANWRMEDGALVADSRSSKINAYLVGKTSYTDLEIYAEFWASGDANSGIFFRCGDRNKIGAKFCYEANILDKGDATGAITGLAKPTPPTRAADRWNSFEITARGPKLVVVTNGQKTAETSDTTFGAGVLALQYLTGTVKFRKVAVRPLP